MSDDRGAVNAGGTATAVESGDPPPPPLFRHGDERRDRLTEAHPELCVYCLKHHRRERTGTRGPLPRYCDRVWGHDGKGRPVGCERLDEVNEIRLAVYTDEQDGGLRLLGDLDLAGHRDHLAELDDTMTALREVVAPLLAALDPVATDVRLTRRSVDTLAEHAVRLAAHARQVVATAKDVVKETTGAAKRAVATAREQAERADQRATRAEQDRAEAVAARFDAEDDAERARRDARQANDRADTAVKTANTLTRQLEEANAKVAASAEELATRTTELANARTRTTELATELAATREQHEQQLTRIADEERTREATLRRDLERAYEIKLGEQRAEAAAERTRHERATQDMIDRLIQDLGAARAQAEQAGELRKDLDRLQARLARLAATPEAAGSPVQTALFALLDGPTDEPAEQRDADDPDEDRQ